MIMSENKTATNKVGAPLLFDTPKKMQLAIDEYFETDAYIETGDTKMYAPTVSGLALSLDMDRKSFVNYSNRDEYFPTIKRARERIAVALEQRLYGNNVTGIIFNLKNNFDWKDKQEIDNTHSFKDITEEELDEKIKQLSKG